MENTQKETKFKPTAEQLAFADAYVRREGNISQACEDIGDASRNKYYSKPNGWRYQEGFEEWLSEYAKKEVLKRAGRWYLILEKYAKAGSFKHLETLMSIAHEFTPGPLVDASQHTHYEIRWKTPEVKESVRNRIEAPQEAVPEETNNER